MGVDHRRFHAPMPQQLLNRPYVVTVLEEMRRERMPQRVTTHVLVDPHGEITLVQRLHTDQMGLQRLDHYGRKHRHPVLSALAIAHNDLTIFKINILHAQLQAFAQPEPGTVEEGSP